MMTRPGIFLCALTLCVLAAWPGCKGQSQPRRHKVAFITNNKSEFWELARRGCQDAAAEFGDVEVIFREPDKATVEQQNQILREVVAQGVQGVAISPVDQLGQVEVLNEIARQTLLITQDSDAPASNRVCYVGTDNEAAGRRAGELVKQALPGGGKIMVFVGQIEAPNANRRYKGLQKALAGSKVEILGVMTDDTDRGKAFRNVTQALREHPDLAGMVGLWSYNGPIILAAVREADRSGKVQIVCFDEEEKTLLGVRQGEIFATIVQQPHQFGYISVQVMREILEGRPAPKENVIVPTKVLDQSNVDQFFEQITRLRQGR